MEEDLGDDIRSLYWVGSSKKDLMKMPSAVIQQFGYLLHLAQTGDVPPVAKVLKGFKGGSVVELKQDSKGDTFRAVYTIRYKGVLYVLHAFQKKSKKGIKTPKEEIDLIEKRLHQAAEHYLELKDGKKNR